MNTKTTLGLDFNPIGFNLNRNLSKLMEENGVSLTLLYRNTGVTIPTIKRLQSDPTTNPTITTLLPIANFFSVTVTQLIGLEPMPNVIGYVENKTYWQHVPLLEWSQVLEWFRLESQIQITSNVLVDIDVGKNAFALTVEEDDWFNMSKGSVLIINTELTPEHKDYAVVYKTGQIIPTLKQVLINEEKIYLKPMSPYFQPVQFDDTYIFLGVLMQIRKNTKI